MFRIIRRRCQKGETYCTTLRIDGDKMKGGGICGLLTGHLRRGLANRSYCMRILDGLSRGPRRASEQSEKNRGGLSCNNVVFEWVGSFPACRAGAINIRYPKKLSSGYVD